MSVKQRQQQTIFYSLSDDFLVGKYHLSYQQTTFVKMTIKQRNSKPNNFLAYLNFLGLGDEWRPLRQGVTYAFQKLHLNELPLIQNQSPLSHSHMKPN